LDATPAQIGTWLRILALCTEAENGGVIAECRQWSERKWLTTCGVMPKEVLTDNPLLQWDGDNLIVTNYSVEHEENAREMRENRRLAGIASGNKRRALAQQNTNTCSTHVQLVLEQNGSPVELKDNVKDNDNSTPIVPTGDEHASASPDQPCTAPSKDVALTVALCRVRAMFRMRRGTPFDSSQERAWKKNRDAIVSTVEEHWKILEWFYALPADDPRAKYRRKDLATLMNNWNGEIIRASEEAAKSGIDPSKTPAKKKEAPADWRDIMGELYPEAHCPENFWELPESIRAHLCEESQKRKGAGK